VLQKFPRPLRDIVDLAWATESVDDIDLLIDVNPFALETRAGAVALEAGDTGRIPFAKEVGKAPAVGVLEVKSSQSAAEGGETSVSSSL